MILRLLPIAAVIVFASGCALSKPKYACGAPGGVTCMGAVEVYTATEHTDRVTGYGADYRGEQRAPLPPGAKPETGVMLEGESMTLTDGLVPTVYPVDRAPAAVPVRSPSRVLRIWLAPWEDDAGDLVMSGHVFTEIEPRRWSVGAPPPSAHATLVPLQVRATNPEPQVSPASATARAQPVSSN